MPSSIPLVHPDIITAVHDIVPIIICDPCICIPSIIIAVSIVAAILDSKDSSEYCTNRNSMAKIIVAENSIILRDDIANIITDEDSMRSIELARTTSGDTDIFTEAIKSIYIFKITKIDWNISKMIICCIYQ